jgi:transposase
MVHERCAGLRVAQGRRAHPAAAILDRRTGQSPPASGTRAGDDGATRCRGSQGHLAVAPVGHLLAAQVTAANVQDRSQVRTVAEKVHEVTGDAAGLVYVDQGYTGAQAAQDAQAHHMQFEVVTGPEAKQGVVWLPKRGVVERSKARAARLRRVAREAERLAETLKGLHVVAFAILRRQRVVERIV